ncbi:MAG: TIGR03943 family protein [Chloroflexota bacterium]
MQRLSKAIVFIALGLFLYSRVVNGTLLFYISQRFVVLTMLAAVGFLIVASSYFYAVQRARPPDSDHEHHHPSWSGLAWLALPVLLGLLVRPQPLGSSALGNRELNVGGLSAANTANQAADSVPPAERNILDWLWAFQRHSDPAAFTSLEAKVIGFVYRDERFAPGTFMVARFTINCCVADASPVGLVVRSAAADSLPEDQWVEVSGTFEPGSFDGKTIPILVADSVVETAVPQQPYLYQ